MKRTGKILRDSQTGPGLLMVEGCQYRFSREDVWKSQLAPKPGLAVEVEFDRHGQIRAIAAIDESQLAQEQMEAAGSAKHRKPERHFVGIRGWIDAVCSAYSRALRRVRKSPGNRTQLP